VPPPPPPGIVIQPPPLDPSKTARERYSAHESVQPCAGCHRLMDKIGFAFEHFDGIGRYRSDDNGQPIDASGEIVDSPSSDGKFDGTSELADKLAASADVRACVARQWLRYAYGVDDRGESACVIDRLVKAAGGGDASLGALLELSANADVLRVRDRGKEDDGSDQPASAPSTSSDAGASDTPGSEPDAAVSGTQKLELIDDNDYGSGYCHTYRITNTGSEPLTWSVSFPIEGTLQQNWESVAEGTTDQITLHGADYNATLEPGATAQFGFCVTR
jgi:hypothetical protein